MIWSVSTSARSSTATLEVTETSGLTGAPRRRQLPPGEARRRCRLTALAARSSARAACPCLVHCASLGSLASAARGTPVSPELPYVGEVTGDRGGRGHRRRDEVRAPARALSALEIPVRRRGAAFSRGENVGVHPEAHRAARLPPLEPG